MPLDILKMPLPSRKKVEIEMEPMEDEASELGEEEEMSEEEIMDSEMGIPALKDVSDEDLLAEVQRRGLA